MKSVLYSVLVLLAVQIFTSSCSEDDDPGANDAPEIPPVETMVMNFETFSAADSRLQTFGNAVRAGNHVSSWREIISTDLAVPVNAFIAAQDKKASKQNDKWVWSYEYNTHGDTYKAELHALPLDSAGRPWQLFISHPGNFEKYKWIEGSSAENLRSGKWTIYSDPDSNVVALNVQWERSAEGEVNDVKYMTGKQDFIHYTRAAEGPLDGTYEIKANGQPVVIQWNTEKKNGRITEQAYFQNELPHCWDTAFEDVQCDNG